MKGPQTQRGSESPPRGMQTIGLDIGETNRRNLAQRRSKKGECPTCGIRTHKIGMFGKKTPMSVDGECVAGRCLRCQPLEGYRTRPPTAQQQQQQSPFVMAQSQQPPQPIGVGQDIVVADDDDDNMSGITMDEALRAESWRGRSTSHMEILDGLQEEGEEEDFAEFPPPQMLRRPEPSIGPDSDYHPEPTHGISHPSGRMQQSDPWPQQNSRPGMHARPGSTANVSVSSSRHSQRQRDLVRPISPGGSRRSERPGRQLSPRRDNFMHTRLPSEIEEESSGKRMSSSSSGLRMSGSSYPAPLVDINGDHDPHNNSFPRDVQYYDDEQEEKNEIQAPENSYRGDSWPNQDPNVIMNERPTSRKDLRPLHRQSRSDPAEISFVPDEQLPPRDGGRHRIPPSQHDIPPGSSRRASSPGHQRGRSTPSPPPSGQSRRRGRRSPAREPPRDIVAPQPFDASGSGITKIPGIIRQLESRAPDPKVRGKTFQSLADIVWISGTEAKMMVKGNDGIKTIEACMWEDIGSGRVQVSAVDLLFALSACSEDGMGEDTDIFLRDSGQTVIDALLISMQTHISVESLQAAGCGALGCLASASSENERVEDGTLSGAVSCVVTGMDAHRKSLEVQKWGLWALYCQCVLARNAESSQKNLAKGAAEAGGVNVIFRAMDINDQDIMVNEWGCKLYWSLSYSDEICSILVKSNQPIVIIMKALRFYQGNLEAAAVVEAAYGALANIARIKRTHPWLRETNVIDIICQSMDSYRDVRGVHTEACALIANIAENQALREASLSYCAPRIFEAMAAFQHDAEFHEEALRALLCLALNSDDAKAEFSKEDNLNIIMDAIDSHQRYPSVLETGFSLVASLCVGRAAGSADMNEVVDHLIGAMQKYPDERKLQEVVCLLLRNLSCREQELVIQSEDFFPCILQIMKSQSVSDTIQINLCCVLSNLLAKTEGVACARVDDGMDQLVKVIQDHMESASVLEMACTAIWHFISSSDDCQRSFVDTGGVDYVKTALLMHPGSPSTLEKVIGVLSCLSGNPSYSRLIATDQGISYIVETMRTHFTEFSLLEYACVILRNVVQNNVGDALEASRGISTIISSLREDTRSTEFEIEACRALWVMAAQDQDSRDKILALDGQEVLMGLQNNTDPNVRDAARGAFNQVLPTR